MVSQYTVIQMCVHIFRNYVWVYIDFSANNIVETAEDHM